MRNVVLSVLCLLLLPGCYSGSSLRVTRGEDLVRERGYVQVNPIRMTEISSTDTILNLDTLLKDSQALAYLKNNRQEDFVSYHQKSVAFAGSAGKSVADADKNAKPAAFDAGDLGKNATQIAYSDLIELAVNSQMLARSLIRRFSGIKAPSPEHKLYCIPVDVSFFPGTVTEQNYRVDVLLKFKPAGQSVELNKSADNANGFKIFAVAPYEYSKISADMRTQLKELFLTAAAKGTVKGLDVTGRFDEVIRNYNKLQSTLSRPEITATLVDDDTVLITYWGHSDLDGDQHLMSGETFRCELFAYYKAPIANNVSSDLSSKHSVDSKSMAYDYMWQYTPTRSFCCFNPRNWFESFPPELSETDWALQPCKPVPPQIPHRRNGWERENESKGEWQNYRYCRKNNELWLDHLPLTGKAP
jgi:hypothetical protein